MHISGLLKLTLLDYPGLVACTIFTKGCNFRCPFCHNRSLVGQGQDTLRIDEAEIIKFLKSREGLLDGVVISGGEPLLQADLEEFLRKVRSMGYSIKLDTNGSGPDKLTQYVKEGLIDYVAMDIKNSPAEYARTAGIPELDFDAVRRSKDFLLEGRIPYEFRTTVVKGLHTRESLMEAAHFIEGAKSYFLQSYSSKGDILHPEGLAAFSDEEMEALLQGVQTILPNTRIRGLES